ncbi:MAG TPA: dihydrofolate reductase family protein [Candidatus Paceibacterota bacterium]|jgi:dihydrofolate reductase|nr:dihydrofolate reductase family protein [Candidatus Paceibacterota bacterium]
MRKIVLFLHQSLDGYCATTTGGLEWIPYNGALEKYAEGIVQSVGIAMYGRKTYELMKGYWPALLNAESATEHEKEHAQWIEGIEKIVFSTTLDKEEWNNTRVISDSVEEEVKKLKEGEGKDLVIFGSPTLAFSLMQMDLIDEFQFTVSPVVLGQGLTFIRKIEKQYNLELVHSEQIEGGIMALHYKIVK